MKTYRNTDTFFDGGGVKVDEFGNRTNINDGLAEARARLNFFEADNDGTDPEIAEIVLVLKEAIKGMEAQR